MLWYNINGIIYGIYIFIACVKGPCVKAFPERYVGNRCPPVVFGIDGCSYNVIGIVPWVDLGVLERYFDALVYPLKPNKEGLEIVTRFDLNSYKNEFQGYYPDVKDEFRGHMIMLISILSYLVSIEKISRYGCPNNEYKVNEIYYKQKFPSCFGNCVEVYQNLFNKLGLQFVVEDDSLYVWGRWQVNSAGESKVINVDGRNILSFRDGILTGDAILDICLGEYKQLELEF